MEHHSATHASDHTAKTLAGQIWGHVEATQFCLASHARVRPHEKRRFAWGNIVLNWRKMPKHLSSGADASTSSTLA